MFRSNLKLYRTRKNITQVELAKKTGVTKDYISMIERGKRNPGIFLAKKISIILDATLDEIFFANKKNN
ncbi:helix-turn-helix transcriptional regulator [Faecalimicrobium sp. JNUCC 81]